MKYQTNPQLGKFINAWGCNLCCILEKVEKSLARFGKAFKFSNPDVVTVYKTAMERGFVQKEVFTEDGEPKDGCTVNNPKAVFNLCAEMFKLPIYCESFRQADADYIPSDGEEEILELKRAGYNGSHFVSGNGNTKSLKDEIEFDPIEGGSRCAREGWIASKRIYTIRKGRHA